MAPSRQSRHAHDVLRTLWPEPARIRAVRWPLFRRVHAPLEYIPLPSRANTKMLIPRRPLRATATAVRNYKTSASASTQRRLDTLATAARLGLADSLPWMLAIYPDRSSPDADIAQYLMSVMGRPLALGIHIGPGRAVQKPVIQLIDADGSTCGFTKVGTRALTRKLVRDEVATLAIVGGVPHRTFRVPRVLHDGQWHDNEVLVLEPLISSPAEPRLPRRVAEAMVELAQIGPASREIVSTSGYWGDLRQQIDELPSSRYSLRLAASLDRVKLVANDIELVFGASHGDWTPWNMAMADGQVILWDWEYFRFGVPLGFDALHFRIQGAVSRGSSPARAFLDAASSTTELLGPCGLIDQIAADLVVTLYVIDIATRYIRDGELQAGTAMGQLDDWLTLVLDRQDQRLDEHRS